MLKSGLGVVTTLVVAMVLLCAPVREAHAVATVEVNVTGPGLGQTSLQLTDMQGNVVEEDERSDRAAGFWYWRNAQPGTYRLQVFRNGVPAGPAREIEVTDNATNRFRADAQSGQVAEVSSGMVPQTMNRFSVGVMGGWKETSWDGTISGGGSRGEGDLDDSLGFFGIEGRYYLSPTQQRMQALGAGLFITGTYFHYLGGGRDRFLLDLHGGAGDDTGAGMEENWSFMLGIGKQWNIYQRLGMALMIGAHMTEADVAALSDESVGGGENLRFEDSELLFGPFVGLEFATSRGFFPAIPALALFIQSRLLWMPDAEVEGESAFTGNNYRAEADGGAQFSGMVGVRLAF